MKYLINKWTQAINISHQSVFLFQNNKFGIYNFNIFWYIEISLKLRIQNIELNMPFNIKL